MKDFKQYLRERKKKNFKYILFNTIFLLSISFACISFAVFKIKNLEDYDVIKENYKNTGYDPILYSEQYSKDYSYLLFNQTKETKDANFKQLLDFSDGWAKENIQLLIDKGYHGKLGGFYTIRNFELDSIATFNKANIYIHIIYGIQRNSTIDNTIETKNISMIIKNTPVQPSKKNPSGLKTIYLEINNNG